MPENSRILIYGYGNPGRQDDALGVKFAEMAEEWARQENYENIETDSNYQLNIEDAIIMKDKDLVIFADASKEKLEDFKLEPLKPRNKTDFTMHHVPPAFLLFLAGELYGYVPETYILHIKGYEWEFMAEPTMQALLNLQKAFGFIQDYLKDFIQK
ncbi:MAG: hypothetical protein JXB00_15895 [Bacteroidales bacterium]|nr:hypothetical protein [Bacteroidales bacterium]